MSTKEILQAAAGSGDQEKCWMTVNPIYSSFQNVNDMCGTNEGNIIVANGFTDDNDTYVEINGKTGKFVRSFFVNSGSGGSANGIRTNSVGDFLLVNGNSLIRTNSSFVPQWTKGVSNATSNNSWHDIYFPSSPTGDIYALGGYFGTTSGFYGAFLFKFDYLGNVIWQRSIASGTNEIYGGSVQVDSSGNVYVFTRFIFALNISCGLKFNSSGTLQWQRFYSGGASSSSFRYSTIDSSNNLYIAGRYSTTANVSSSNTPVLLKINPADGTILWQRNPIYTSQYGSFDSITYSDDGFIYVGGVTAVLTGSPNFGAGPLFKFNTSGTLQWERRLLTTLVPNNVYPEYPVIGYANMVVKDGFMYLPSAIQANEYGWGETGMLLKLPDDGSLTGQLGFYSYENASSTINTTGVTSTAGNLTVTSSSITLTTVTPTTSSVAVNLSTSEILPWYWITTVGSSGNVTYIIDVAIDSVGDICVVGKIESTTNIAFISKYSTSGSLVWTKTLDGSGIESFAGISTDGTNFYAVGQTTTSGGGGINCLIAKYDTGGTLLWQRTLGGVNTDYAYGITTTTAGVSYVVGTTTATNANMLIFYYSTTGTLLWQRSFDVTGFQDYGYKISLAPSTADLLIVGHTSNNSALLVVTYKTNGTLSSHRVLYNAGGITEGYGCGVALNGSTSGRFLCVCGFTTAAGDSDGDLILAQYNATGTTLQWQRILSGLNAEYGVSVCTDATSSIYVAGMTESATGTAEGLIVKYSPDAGYVVWQRRLGTSANDYIESINSDPFGNLVVVGYSSDGQSFIGRLPGTGNLTGTYGSFTYAATTLTSSNSTFTNTTTTVTEASAGLTSATSTLTDGTTTFNDAKSVVQTGGS